MSTKRENLREISFNEDDIILHFSDGRKVSTPLAFYPRLLHATSEQREKWEMIGANSGIRWPDLDEDLSIEGILHGIPSVEYRKSCCSSDRAFDPFEPSEAVLLELHSDESKNIEYTKTRTYWLMAAYSTVCAFLISNHIPTEIESTFLLGILFILSLLLTGACCRAIVKNYDAIIKRRKKLEYLHKELKSPFSVEPKCDSWIPVIQIGYVLTVYLVMILTALHGFKLI